VTEAKLLVAAPDFPGVSCFLSASSASPIFGAVMLEGLFQPVHVLVIFGIALFVFGPRKLPELGKGIGDGIRGFKSAMTETAAEEPTEAKTDVVKD
jgi:sec-independent protein translocase protein TatA